MLKEKPAGGRPKHVAEYAEGSEASANFMGAMRHIISVRQDSDLKQSKPVKSRKSK